VSVVITLLNQKGGVGKTSTCHHLSGALSKLGRRVLLVDNDPQSSLTQGFWGPILARQLDPSATVAALYAGERPFPGQVIQPTGVPGVDILPGSRAATDWNVPRPHEADPEVQECIRAFLEEARESYDVVLIDCPPNLHLCSWAALVGSDYLIVPTQPEDYGAQGLADVQESYARVVAGPNPGLELLGYLITMSVARKSIHKLYEEVLRGQYGAAVFEAVVPEATDYVEAIAQRKPVAQYKPRGSAAKAIAAVADEILARIAERGRVAERGAA
jgi:chromosome partitioning protein